ncbi:MAG: family 10 glycosylhydrolase [Chitinophagaceae bacterium]
MRKFNLLLAVTLCSLFVVAQNQNPEPIRGTWITNVASDVLKSKANICKAVQQCKENGLNTIFVVVWNGGVTMYPSEVVKKYTGVKQSAVYAGRDPIKEIIEEGHKAGLKVHAWFEFGFSYGYKDTSSIWLKKYPTWAGRNNKGGLLQKNGFYWWNSINPQVQKFMKELVTEVVQKYKVDGIQGDDRLPAMPAEGGYDAATIKLYAKQHCGKKPPNNPKDSLWLQWKADQLSAFGKSLYQLVKKTKPECTVSWAPSIYPWSKEQYLQDWPKWLEGGYADYIIPQLYRYKADAYETILKELRSQVTDRFRDRVFPGILTSLGDGYQSTRELTDKMIALNRSYGFSGEVFFYFETLNRLKGRFYSGE